MEGKSGQFAAVSWQPFKLPLLKSAEVKGLLMHPAPLSRLQTAWHSTTNTLRWFCVLQHLLPEPGWDAESSPALEGLAQAQQSAVAPAQNWESSAESHWCVLNIHPDTCTNGTPLLSPLTQVMENQLQSFMSHFLRKKNKWGKIIPISYSLCNTRELFLGHLSSQL